MINWFNANLKEAMSFLPLTGEIFFGQKMLKNTCIYSVLWQK